MQKTWSDAQLAVIQKVYDLLGEHFDNAVFIVSADVYVGDRTATAQKMNFKGGAMAALGMLTWGGDQILDTDRNKPIPGV